MKILMMAVTVLSLAACLAAGFAHFLGRVTYTQYTTSFVVFSIIYFVAATVWAEMRKKTPAN